MQKNIQQQDEPIASGGNNGQENIQEVLKNELSGIVKKRKMEKEMMGKGKGKGGRIVDAVEKERKNQYKIIVGNNIRRARLARRISIDEMADILGLTSGFVGLIERGERGASTYIILKLAIAFNVTTDSFFYGTDALTPVSDYKSALVEKAATIAREIPENRLEYTIDLLKGLRDLG